MRSLLNGLLDCLVALFYAIGTILVTPFMIIGYVVAIIFYPIIHLWKLFQIGFIFRYYVMGKYHNLSIGILRDCNININSDCRQRNTLRNRIFNGEQ